ncbi:adenylosuccinate synthase [Subdoligranulum sp. DSM 109015]|uniref:Adenylosuccinate synthetase n=1 Tax=Gemmiger gallinarum TaxID=2779354 RepID=A0ABR9R1M4_9FIRM|nr:adenylosuccinate synthase [Gemmiger gallinarum]MBE5037024.1 adenylosuccinate synthase [Gemmiger gallinarum]
MLTAITGINWGDEGKGRMVDLLSRDYDIVARYQGGDNAGHTVKNERGKFVLNLIPSGILRPEVVCVMGGGMVIDPHHLEGEIDTLRSQGIEITPANLKISDRATITMPFHVDQDGLEEARLSKTGAQFGSTKRGIAYTYGDKFMKKTLRMGDLLHMDEGVRKRLATIVESKNLTMEKIYGQKPVSLDEMWAWCQHYAEVFAPFICNVGDFLAKADDAGKKIMFEAQLGALRDIDFGIYPYTSSSNTIGAYAPIGAGIPGRKLDLSVGIMKAYSSCVGEGPFTAELAMTEEEKDVLREHGHEYGAATGRPRRVGPFDVVASRYGVQCQGCDELALTLLDVLDYMEEVPVVTHYELTDGTVTDVFPMGKTLDDAKPVVEKLPGWNCDITGVRHFEDLPKAAQDYVLYIEKAVGCKIKYISVGPEREACIVRD